MRFDQFSRLCESIEGVSGRLDTIQMIAEAIPTLIDSELPVFIRFLMGKVFPDWSEQVLGIGPNLLYEGVAYVTGLKKGDVVTTIAGEGDVGRAVERLLAKKVQTSFFSEEPGIMEVYSDLTRIALSGGVNSQREKLRGIKKLFANATPLEGRYLARLLLEDMRIGVGEGNVREAIAQAFQIESSLVEHAHQALNDLGEVAVLARTGEESLKNVRIRLFHPVKMMLSQVGSIQGAIADHKTIIAEVKYDGSRFQFHREGKKARVYSRRLEDVTTALPDVVARLNEACSHDVILDGEVIAIKDGKPMPFQNVLRRFRRKHDVATMRDEVAMLPIVFDILYCDGETLIDLPVTARRQRLLEVVNGVAAPQLVSAATEEVEAFYQAALSEGHEGIMIKVPSSCYTPGVRGKNWLKVKPQVDTLDLLVIGADWGEGKRGRVFGSFLLACRNDAGAFSPVTRVATGFSDEELATLHDLLKDRVITASGREVTFEGDLVFEVGYAEVQISPNYAVGFALRFPRFIRVRDDKGKGDIDSIGTIRERYALQNRNAI
ncbi:MAG: ATP-dependent DNA ligase [Methanomicrobiales archaeon]|nr:ATP-dependent DNA ligase [Methanomicrobiales archaeon]